MQRCGWVSQDPLYIEYHDNEWGVAEKNPRKLFEMICLEGQQAGLSWITVLKKRENYRSAFHQFDPVRVAAMDEEDVERLVLDAGIIRHRGKIQAIIGNARAFLAMDTAAAKLAIDWVGDSNLKAELFADSFDRVFTESEIVSKTRKAIQEATEALALFDTIAEQAS